MDTAQNKLLSALKEIGVDVDGTISRFMDNSEIYIRFITRFPQEDRVTPIKEAIESGDSERIISAAHKMKGTSANLGMTELSAAAAVIVDKARNGISDGLGDDYEKVRSLSEIVCGTIKENA